MPNQMYVKGRKKEYKLIRQEKEFGRIAFRSAGSHSPVDVVSIDLETRTIRFIQCKPETMKDSEKRKIEEALIELNGNFTVSYEVI